MSSKRVADPIRHAARQAIWSHLRAQENSIFKSGDLPTFNFGEAGRMGLSVLLLADMLDQLNYKFRYHQFIGFLLDRAGNFDEPKVELFLQRPRDVDFYLENTAHEQEVAYSRRWRMHYPKRMDTSDT